MKQSLEKDLLLIMLLKAASDVKHEVADRISYCLSTSLKQAISGKQL